MRLLLVLAFVGVAAAPARADIVVDPSAPWPDRINPCAAAWNNATPEQRGTMSYRQFVQKCVGGRTALPFKAKALCADNSTSTGDTPEGACVDNGGVAEWAN